MKLFGRGHPKPERPGVTAAPSPEVLRQVRHLEVRTRGLVESLFSGEFASVFQGRGMEFSHVREYQAGDDVRAIDWKVTARRGVPFIRQFVEERDLLVVLMIDVSASGAFGPGERSAGEVAAEIASALAFAATRNNDRIALLLISDRVESLLAPARGRRHTVRLLAELISHRPTGRSTDLTPGLEWVGRTNTRRATVFVISDFIQDRHAPRFQSALGRLGRAHDLVAIRLSSRAMVELPNVGCVEMTDPESGMRLVCDSGSRMVRECYRRSVHRDRAAMAALLTEVGAELVDVDTTLDPLDQIAVFFRRRLRSRR